MNISLPKEQQSLWMPIASKAYPSLRDDIEADVAIVGGGIAGVTIAYKLQQAGYRVAVIEKNLIASGTTGGTTGKVSTQHNIIYSTLMKKFGRRNAQIYADMQKNALADIATVIRNEKIACEWTREDHFLYTNNASTLKQFQQETESATSLGLPAAYIDRSLALPFPTKGGVKVARQAKFNAYLYTRELAQKVHEKGGYIFENSQVKKVKKSDPATIETDGGSVTAAHIIIATKIPPAPLLGRLTYASIVYPENSYIVAGQTTSDIKGMYNTPDKKHYSLLAVQNQEKSYLLVGGENHIPGLGVAGRHYKKLAAYSARWFNVSAIEHKWRAMDYIAYDNLPVIGELYPGCKNIYAVSGFKKWGLTTSMVAARVFMDILEGIKSPSRQLFYPHRASAPLSIPEATIEYLKR